jgi:anaerobic selenocysteine-containing dehydrogenase
MHYRNCHLCEAMCGVVVETRDGHITSIKGDEQDPFSRGHICPKALGLKDVHEDPNRLRHPVKRTADGWVEVSWREAFRDIAARLVALQREHGKNAVATYFGNPQVHSYSALLGGATLARSLRSIHRYSATSVDQLPHHFASLQLFGHQLLLPIPDVDRTQFLLVIGGNPLVSNGSLMTAPDLARRLKDLRKRHGQLVVVDPRRTETAEVADQHLFIKPGTDAWLLLALLQVIFDEKLNTLDHLSSVTTGLDELKALVAPFTPEVAAKHTQIDTHQIRELARRFARAESAVCYGRMGVSTQEFGALCQWLIQALNIVTGNLDRPGGAMFTRPAFDALGLSSAMGQRGSFDRRRTRVRALPEFGGEFPVAALAEEILTPGDGQIKALVTAAGNPVLSTPNGRQLDRALAQLDFMVSIDIYINETTRHAHYILPPTFGLERDHYDLIFHALAIRNTTKYADALLKPSPNSMHDWQIFDQLVEHIEAADPSRKRPWLERLRAKWLTPKRAIALGLRFGPYGARWNPIGKGLTLAKVAAAPHGIDLGPLKPCLPNRLFTRDKMITLVLPVFRKDLERLHQSATDASVNTSTLSLIGRRDLRTNNSWLHNSRRFVKGPNRCTLLMNPIDASARHLENGAMVTVTSRVGSVHAELKITDEIAPGVVSLPHGWGHDREGIKLDVARAHPGVSVNDLTDEQHLDSLCGNAALNGVPVTVS